MTYAKVQDGKEFFTFSDSVRASGQILRVAGATSDRIKIGLHGQDGLLLDKEGAAVIGEMLLYFAYSGKLPIAEEGDVLPWTSLI